MSLSIRATKNPNLVIDEALKAAAEATADYIIKHGEHPFNCGFAWVVIRPATGPIVKALKERKLGDKAYGGGFSVWNPSKNFTQDMSAKYEGAKAFAKVLDAEGVVCFADQRLD